jgi:hypothetical protein
MSVVVDLRPGIREVPTMAQQYVVEVMDLLMPNQTIAQNPDVMQMLREAAILVEPCGGNGWLFVFGDRSAIVANNTKHQIWRRWIA